MDNYKYAGAFERLAIRIVEYQSQLKLDNEKTYITQTTRDYGVDSIICFENHEFSSSTIEAKLRQSSYTLALKDIASSILFFLVRRGDTHFIVSNVFMTTGTIETIKLLNLQSESKICYIAGEETQKALQNILENLDDNEETELARLLLENFKNNKIPKKLVEQTNIKNDVLKDDEDKIFPSRKIILNELVDEIRRGRQIILINGANKIGKRTLVANLNHALSKGFYMPIVIDAFKNNTIDVFCHELTQKLIGVDLNDILNMLSKEDLTKIENCFNPLEKEYFHNLNTIFHSHKISDTSASYLAMNYLNLIFQKRSKVKYVIEIENFSYTSQELFDWIKNFAVNVPENVCIICIFTQDISSVHYDFSVLYKKIYESKIKEINLEGITWEETKLYLENKSLHLSEKLSKKIHDFTKGNPYLLKQISSTISEKIVLINEDVLEGVLQETGKINYERLKNTIGKYPIVFLFFFLLYIFSFHLKQSIWEKCYCNIFKDNSQDMQYLQQNIIETSLVQHAHGTYFCNDFYLIREVEHYFESNALALSEPMLSSVYKHLLGNMTPLAEIKLCYCENSNFITQIYEDKKDLWMYKSNTDWHKYALKLISLFFLQNESEDIYFIMKSINYYIKYLNIIYYIGRFEQQLINKINEYIELLLSVFEELPKDTQNVCADILADTYAFRYNFYRKLSNYENANRMLENISSEIWFHNTPEIKKIKLLRYQALTYKAIGKREVFTSILEKIFCTYKHNAYTKVIYWANKAVEFYLENPLKAVEYLNNCELDKLIEQYPKEISLYLWVSNDLGIVSFYSNHLVTARNIAKDILERSIKLNDLENAARAHNILGALALKENKIKEAKKEFYSAFTLCADVHSEAFFHFVVNYLITIEHSEINLNHLILDYIKANQKRLIDILETTNLENCRWFITLCTFELVLQLRCPNLKVELECVFGKFFTDYSDVILDKYLVNGKPIVLF